MRTGKNASALVGLLKAASHGGGPGARLAPCEQTEFSREHAQRIRVSNLRARVNIQSVR